MHVRWGMDNARVLIAGEVSEWLHKLRLQAGLSIHQAAKAAQCSDNAIINWETGFPIPFPELLVLLRLYGVRTGSIRTKIDDLYKVINL